MVFHNSVLFASNNTELQKLSHYNHPSSMEQTTMTMMPCIHQQKKVQSQLIMLLTGLDEMIKHSVCTALGL
jgi:hypothetical protein